MIVNPSTGLAISRSKQIPIMTKISVNKVSELSMPLTKVPVWWIFLNK